MSYVITTRHYGTIQFMYGDGAPLWSDRRSELEAKFQAKLDDVTRGFGVWNNTSFCTQAEGYQIYGENKEWVEAAIKKLSTYMQRFKDVEFLDEEDE